MKQLFAYIRVSDPKQTTGVSLIEQRAIIERYAARVGAEVSQWFEETRTAAKAGRPVFNRLLAALRARKADGVIIHKLDRGTRNLRDWVAIDDLIESGIEVHVANEGLDLRSRGGRLSADLQVAIAVDYIRNLREEALKGIHGRLKQGILPGAVCVGYIDTGKGNPKRIHPTKGPLVKHLFQRYATGAFSLRDMVAEASRIGLHNRNGHSLRLAEIQKILRNSFYVGIIRSKRFGVFAGAHEPLVTPGLFDRVQELLDGKMVRRTKRHDYLFRRALRCKTCGRSLVGSLAKGFVYYRCPTIDCPTTSVREDRVEEAVRSLLRFCTLTPADTGAIENHLYALSADVVNLRTSRETATTQALAAVNSRLSRLTDLLLDERLDPQEHAAKRAILVTERSKLEQNLTGLRAVEWDPAAHVRKIVELAKSPETLYESATVDQKRHLLRIVLSNCRVSGKSLEFTLREPFATLAHRAAQENGGPYCYTDRTLARRSTISPVEFMELSRDFPASLLDSFCRIGVDDNSATV
jgi:DNA invertase Pin-like site-specific DNA recombinase